MNIEYLFENYLTDMTTHLLGAYEQYYYNPFYVDNFMLQNKRDSAEYCIESYKKKQSYINLHWYWIRDNNIVYTIDNVHTSFILRDCLCIDISIKPISGYLSVIVQLNPRSKVYKYIKFLENILENHQIMLDGRLLKQMKKCIKHITNASIIDANNRMRISMRPEAIIEKGKIYLGHRKTLAFRQGI